MTRITVFCLALFVMTQPVNAQEGAEPDNSKFGLGVNIAPDRLTQIFGGGNSLTTIYLSFLKSGLKVEPHLGFYRYSSTLEVSGGDDLTSSTNVVQAGIGIFKRADKSQTAVYYGARSGVRWFFEGFGFEDDVNYDHRLDLILEPTIGGEHFLGDHFSLGAEIKYSLRLIGAFDTVKDVSNLESQTAADVFLRFYLN